MFEGSMLRTAIKNCILVGRFSSITQPLCSSQLISKEGPAENDSKPFVLLEEKKCIIPVFDLSRRLGNVLAQFRYRYFFEKQFSVESFLSGAVQASILCGDYIRRKDWSNLRRIMVEDCVSELQARLSSSDQCLERLKFSLDDVICSVIDSSYTCGKLQPGVSGVRSFLPLKHRAFYTQVIIYIKKSNIDQNMNIEQLLRTSPRRSLLICNITLSRILNPLGMWKVTRINFFDYP
ncbi:unnamed protein product [Thelazia callipaeda]|uniref:Uncharacterized protein n=1 Tax=Thelazia callipaeda TaxID=103827 RepID=A0A0N5CJR2_THECL|nr:unnamed protein product [Thelazia callipaeda]